MSLKLKVSQRSEAFFELFLESGRNVRTACELLADLVKDYREVETKAGRIRDLEHRGDEITHAIIDRLNTSLVTPMDREDIYALASALDDVLDEVEAAADLFNLQRVRTPLPEMTGQVRVLLKAAERTEEALALLPSMRRERLEPFWVEINRLENEGDQIYRWALSNLFVAGHDEMDVLKWKEVFESLEEVIDDFERVADVIESIILKHA